MKVSCSNLKVLIYFFTFQNLTLDTSEDLSLGTSLELLKVHSGFLAMP